MDNNFYVYVYIDPRSFQEFYYGKGRGNRKLAHLYDDADTEKTRIINAIKKEGKTPIIKVIAKGLTEDQALLIEKTLIWKLGRNLTNKSSGHFAKNFRPHETFHKNLHGFDFENKIYCINVGEGIHRCWEDCLDYNFISAGQDWNKWGRKINNLNKGDILCVYLSDHGYVGVGKVVESAVSVLDFRHQNKPLSEYKLRKPKLYQDKAGTKDGEYLVLVKWLSVKRREEAVGKERPIWKASSMMGTLENQPKTLEFLEKQFRVSFDRLLTMGVRG